MTVTQSTQDMRTMENAHSPQRAHTDITYYDHGTAAERWERARQFFEAKEYAVAARILAPLADEVPEQVAPRLLLARAYYHSAQLRRAESALRRVLELDPVESYARLMLGRTLERQGRDAEAAPQLRLAAALTGE